jgi:hypothetical protein
MIPGRKFESGAIGTFSHMTALHDTKYFSEIEVIADGYQLTYVTKRLLSTQLTG